MAEASDGPLNQVAAGVEEGMNMLRRKEIGSEYPLFISKEMSRTIILCVQLSLVNRGVPWSKCRASVRHPNVLSETHRRRSQSLSS